MVIDENGQLSSVAASSGSGSGTVTIVALSGGTTGLTSTGGPITSSGTFTLGGKLVVANGGTGSSTAPTQGGVIYAASTSAYASTEAGTAGQVLTSNGAGAPTWTTPAVAAIGSDSGRNTIAGTAALTSNRSGSDNTAIGFWSLYNNTSGLANSSVGSYSLMNNTSGFGNTALGLNSLYKNTTGTYNTAVGNNPLYYNTTGSNNIALGYQAGASLTTGNFNIAIGHPGVADEGNTLRLGTPYIGPAWNQGGQNRAFIAGITGVTSTGGAAVYINSSGQLGTLTSSLRFKENIQPMADLSSRILNLRPVTFTYKAEYGGGGLQYGLIAEEVDQVIPEMTVRDKDGQIETVAYQMLPPMLLNEAQKQHKAIEALQAENQSLKAENQATKAKLEDLQAQVAEILAKLGK